MDDRDYMRERARERVRSDAPLRPRFRRTRIETWLEFPFRNQKAALATAAIGLVLTSGIPASLVSAIAPSGPIDVDPHTMMTSMVTRSAAMAATAFLPVARLLGLAFLVSSGVALIRGRRRWNRSTVIRDPAVSAAIGWVLIAIASWNVVAHGLWTEQARRTEAATTAIAQGRAAAAAASVASPTPSNPTATSGSGAPAPVLAPDRPFPANGTFERALPLRGRIARMSFANRSQDNAIVVWLYDLRDGRGDHEALRLYVAAGQSATVDLPAFDYRMAVYEAPTSLGLDRGFGPDARPKDLGLVDLKTSAELLSQQPSGLYNGFGIFTFRPGVYAVRR